MNVLLKRTGDRTAPPSRIGVRAAKDDTQAKAARECAIGVLILVTMSVLPNLAKFGGESGDSGSVTGTVVFGSIYIFALSRLVTTNVLNKELLWKTLPILSFNALLVISTLWSSFPAATFKAAGEMLGTTIVGYYFATRFRTAELLNVVCIAYAINACLCAFLIVFAPAHGRAAWGTSGWCGFYSEKNGFGVVMGFAAIASLLKGLSSKRRARIAFLLGTCAFAVLLGGSLSATAWVVTVATIAAAIVLLIWVSPRFGLLAAFGVFIVCSIFATVVALGDFSSNPFLQAIGRDSTLTGRTDFWPGIVKGIGAKPILGYGYAAFFLPGGEGEQYLDGLTGWWHPTHAHNSFFQISLDVGYVGVAVMAIVLLQATASSIVVVARTRVATDAWPFCVLLFLILGSYTETYFGIRNSVESVFFVTAVVSAVMRANLSFSNPSRRRNRVPSIPERTLDRNAPVR